MLNRLKLLFGYGPASTLSAGLNSIEPKPTATLAASDGPSALHLPKDLQVYAMLASQTKNEQKKELLLCWEDIQASIKYHSAFTQALLNKWRDKSTVIAAETNEEINEQDEQAIQNIQELTKNANEFLTAACFEFEKRVSKLKAQNRNKNRLVLFLGQRFEASEARVLLIGCLTQITESFQKTVITERGCFERLVFNTALNLLIHLQGQLLNLDQLVIDMKQEEMKLTEIQQLKDLMQVPLQNITNEIYEFHSILYDLLAPQSKSRLA